MKFDDEGNIWLRQSWLDTAMRCAERGRFAIIKPEWDAMTSDSAAIGTAAHAGIEAHINIENSLGDETLIAPIEAIRIALNEELALGVKWTKYETPQQLFDNARRCYEAWVEGILPVFSDMGLIQGARTEVEFKVVLFTLPDGRTVGITGTADLAPAVPVLGDWKTAAREYRAREKQKYAIQPTVYSHAAVLGAMRDDIEYRYPMTFHYGILVRGDRKAKPQIVTVTRTAAHAEFAIERIKQYVDLALNFTLDRSWPRTDEGNFLCSQTWCPWWQICKGAHAVNDSVPVQLELRKAA
jgi:PD-(D/E)XK nuclease superfamily